MNTPTDGQKSATTSGSIFVLVPERTAWWPVHFTVPAEDDPGFVVEQKIEMKFRFIDEDALEAIKAEATALDEANMEARKSNQPAMSAGEAAAEVFMRIIADWRGVGSSPTQQLPFNKANLALLLKSMPGFARRWLLPAYASCLAGEGEIRSGN